MYCWIINLSDLHCLSLPAVNPAGELAASESAKIADSERHNLMSLYLQPTMIKSAAVLYLTRITIRDEVMEKCTVVISG